MRSIFIVPIFLLFLSSCSEEKTQNKNQEEKQIIGQETLQNNETSKETKQEVVNSENTSESIVPANDNNQTDEISTPDSQEQKNTEIKPVKVTFKVDDNDMVLGNKKSNVIVVSIFSYLSALCLLSSNNFSGT